jgi:uncharacterized lipoprotein YmbA
MEDRQSPGAPACGDARGVTIGIGPIALPKYLDRQQIMTRVSESELRLSEFHLWAEPLKDNITRVTAQNLGTLLCARAKIYPWMDPEPPDLRLSMNITRLEAVPGGDAVLDVQWTVFDEHAKKTVLARESRFTEHAGPGGYDDLVTAYSRLLSAFSREAAGLLAPRMKAVGAQ